MKEKKVKDKDFYKVIGISLLILFALLAVILLSLFISKDKGELNAISPLAQTTQKSPELKNEKLVLGSSDAKLTIVEYADFECPFCRRFYSETYHQIISTYVDTGKVKYVYKNFPLTNIHPNALGAALAYECAVEQGKGSEYHDKLFESSDLRDTILKSISVELSLDVNQFDDCLDSKKYEQKVLADLVEGGKKGVSGTPTLFVGDTKLVGAQPFSVFKKEIDKQLVALG